MRNGPLRYPPLSSADKLRVEKLLPHYALRTISEKTGVPFFRLLANYDPAELEDQRARVKASAKSRARSGARRAVQNMTNGRRTGLLPTATGGPPCGRPRRAFNFIG